MANLNSNFFNRLRYLNLEHNEISSIPHLRLLGARVRDLSLKENEDASNEELGDSSAPSFPQEKDSDSQAKNEGRFSDIKEESKSEEKKESNEELILDEVDKILNQNLADDEQNEEHKRPEMKPKSSVLTEDASLLGTFIGMYFGGLDF